MITDFNISSLTLEQKACLCVGMNFWMTQCYPEAGIPSLFMADGPHGLRKQDISSSDHLGLQDSRKSVCYPTGSLNACSWDRDLIQKMGDYLGKEAAQLGVDILLGPAINIKRSPLCGRNFEYYSEDPYLAGQLASAFINGVQSNNVAACPKHFVANNQETRRKAVDTIVDKRTLKEIYLVPFESSVCDGNAWSIMSSYNKVNGSYPAESLYLSKEILRGEWGFQGAYITDWGAMDQIVASIKAGLSIQMPGDDGTASKKLLKAVKAGEISEEELNQAIKSLLYVIQKTRNRNQIVTTSKDYHNLAYEIAVKSIVLLKNEDNILPLRPTDNIGIIGDMAVNPRYQGSGSSHVNPYHLENAHDELKKIYPQLAFAKGYEDEHTTPELIAKAIDVTRHSDIVIIFTGLPSSYESEAFDRENMAMPQDHNELINTLSDINPNIIVVLSNGAPIEMPWLSKVKGLIETYLGGEAGGSAVSHILCGKVNPSGKLAETIPEKLAHNPSSLNFPGEGDRVEYREGVFIGYRYYEKKQIKPAFPFGFGLSYTSFEYSDLRLDKGEMTDKDKLGVTLTVKNIGSLFGQEVVQLYVASNDSKIIRPNKELKEFIKIGLEAGESKEIEFELNKRAFAYYDTYINDWHVDTSTYQICVGSSSQDIRLTSEVYIKSTVEITRPITRNTLFSDILSDSKLMEVFMPIYQQIKPHLPFNLNNIDIKKDKMSRAILENMTLNSLSSYVGKYFDDEVLQELIDKLNMVE